MRAWFCSLPVIKLARERRNYRTSCCKNVNLRGVGGHRNNRLLNLAAAWRGDLSKHRLCVAQVTLILKIWLMTFYHLLAFESDKQYSAFFVQPLGTALPLYRTGVSLLSIESFLYTRCNRRNGPDFGRVFLRSNYTDITQNTYIQSSMVTQILAREVRNFDSYYTLTDYQIHIETGRNMWFL